MQVMTCQHACVLFIKNWEHFAVNKRKMQILTCQHVRAKRT